MLESAEVPSGPILSIAEIARDPHYLARRMFERVVLPDGTPLAVPRITPQLSRTPAITTTAVRISARTTTRCGARWG